MMERHRQIYAITSLTTASKDVVLTAMENIQKMILERGDSLKNHYANIHYAEPLLHQFANLTNIMHTVGNSTHSKLEISLQNTETGHVYQILSRLPDTFSQLTTTTTQILESSLESLQICEQNRLNLIREHQNSMDFLKSSLQERQREINELTLSKENLQKQLMEHASKNRELETVLRAQAREMEITGKEQEANSNVFETKVQVLEEKLMTLRQERDNLVADKRKLTSQLKQKYFQFS